MNPRWEIKRAEPKASLASSPVLRSKFYGMWPERSPGTEARLSAPRPDSPGLSKSHISASFAQRPASLEFYRGANFLKVRVENDPSNPMPPKRKEISHFTDASRRRMMDLMAKIENGLVPVFVTLTYPDDFPVYHERFKRHLDLLGQRMLRRWPESFILWKLEFKRRKSGANKGKIAPHYHLFLYNVPWEFPFKQEVGERYSVKFQKGDGWQQWQQTVTSADKCGFWRGTMSSVVDVNGEPVILMDSLRDWMARNWYEIVDSNNFRHYQAGTRVEQLRTVKGAMYYASKNYMGKKEEMAELEHKPGRFWGVIGRKNLKLGKREVKEITAKQAFTVQRMIRRYRRANTEPKRRKYLKGDQFSTKLYGDVDYWLERLLKLIGDYPKPSWECLRESGETWMRKRERVPVPDQPAGASNDWKRERQGTEPS